MNAYFRFFGFAMILWAGLFGLWSNAALSGAVWIPTTQPVPMGTGMFQTTINYTAWHATVGAYSITLKYDPTALQILGITLPTSSNFQGNAFIDTASFNSGATTITGFQTATIIPTTSPTTFATVLWKSLQATQNVTTAIQIVPQTVVEAKFNPVDVLANGTNYTAAYPLQVNIPGTRFGTVVGLPSGIACGSATCNSSLANGTAVTLTAIPSSGYQFAGWGGACSGYGNSCTVTMNAAQTVTANFAAFKIHEPIWKRAIGSIIQRGG